MGKDVNAPNRMQAASRLRDINKPHSVSAPYYVISANAMRRDLPGQELSGLVDEINFAPSVSRRNLPWVRSNGPRVFPRDAQS